jgi:hypothetical protein
MGWDSENHRFPELRYFQVDDEEQLKALFWVTNMGG